MRDIVSKLVHYASWLSVILTGLATAWWATIVADSNSESAGWSAFFFIVLVPMQLGGGTLLLGVVPSSILWLRNKQRRDRMSLLLAGCSLLVVLVESLFLFYYKM